MHHSIHTTVLVLVFILEQVILVTNHDVQGVFIILIALLSLSLFGILPCLRFILINYVLGNCLCSHIFLSQGLAVSLLLIPSLFIVGSVPCIFHNLSSITNTLIILLVNLIHTFIIVNIITILISLIKTVLLNILPLLLKRGLQSISEHSFNATCGQPALFQLRFQISHTQVLKFFRRLCHY